MLPCRMIGRRDRADDVDMSHQGHHGWFPECLICGLGNLGAIVCVTPDFGDQHGLTPIVGPDLEISTLEQGSDGHWWKSCLLCDHLTLADARA